MTQDNNIVVAISGGSGAGKSSIAEAFVAVLGARATAISQDWYFRPVADGADRSGGSKPNFQHPDNVDFAALARDISALRDGRAVLAPENLEVSEVGPLRRVLEPRPVIVVEGELILHDESVRRLLDHSVFLDAPADLRLVRRLRRDARERGLNAASVLAQYVTKVRPLHDAFVEPQRHHADVVLDASSQEALETAGAKLAAWVRARLDRGRQLRAGEIG